VKLKLNSQTLYVVVVAGLLVYAAAFWFLAVSPKRAKAGETGKEAANLETVVATARRSATAPPDSQPIAVADVFRLAKAMPSVPDMPGIVLELARIAEETGIEFKSINPQTSTVKGDYQVVPVTLVFDGTFYELSDLLFRLRTLVGVRHGKLDATGRLYSVQTLDFAESTNGFPEITANLTVEAYVYGTDASGTTLPAAPESAAPPASEPAPAPAAGAEAAPAGTG
jgi:type IV pilus assembly protein PilO